MKSEKVECLVSTSILTYYSIIHFFVDWAITYGDKTKSNRQFFFGETREIPVRISKEREIVNSQTFDTNFKS